MLIAMVTVMVVGSHIYGGSVAYTDVIGGGMVTIVEMMVTLMLIVVKAHWC